MSVVVICMNFQVIILAPADGGQPIEVLIQGNFSPSTASHQGDIVADVAKVNGSTGSIGIGRSNS